MTVENKGLIAQTKLTTAIYDYLLLKTQKILAKQFLKLRYLLRRINDSNHY